MTTLEFFSFMRDLDVKLWIEGERLRYSAPTGTLTPDLLKQLAERKADLVSFLREIGAVTRAASQAIPVASRDRAIPLSFAQQRLWIFDRLNPGTTVYNISGAVRLHGRLHQQAFEQSFREIVQRHEILRTTFIMTGGQPFQTISPHPKLDFNVIDLREADEAERETTAQRLALEAAQTPFDLETGPLLRARLLRMSEEEHMLLLTMHHIISDGWSVGVLVREFAVLYEAFATGKPSPLPPLPIQYADFAIWQRGWLSGEVLETQLAYWKRQLGSNPPVIELPADRPRPAVQTFRGARQSITLPASLLAELKELARREGATLSIVLLTALKVLLFRYTGQTDIPVGTTIANRNRSETEGLIGFFVNTLVMRTDLSGNPTFTALLQRVREVALEAYAHQDLPFEKLVDELQPKRDMSRTPLFQIMFDLQSASAPPREFHGLSFTSELIEDKTAKFDLTLNLREHEQGLWASFEYNTDLFEEATIVRLLTHFRTLLEAIAADPGRPISALPLLRPEEQRLLLAEWSGNQASASPEHGCLHEWFEEQATLRPRGVAVSCGARQMSYGELNARANRLAHGLRRLGVGPEVLVGLYIERSVEAVVGVLGILKAGGAYLPLDPAYPKQRLAFILQDSRVAVLLTQEKLSASLPPHEVHVLCLDSEWEAVVLESEENLVHRTLPENLAYVIYTSGSTGTPKGTLVSHANVVRLFEATQSWFNFSSDDVWTLFHSHAFDFSVWELWGALLYGGRLVVVPYLTSRSPEAFYELLRAEQVSVLNQTPSAFRQLIKAEESLETLADLNLRLVIFGGEALEFQSLKPWFERHGDSHPQLVNMYGITETTVHVTYRPLTSKDVGGTPSSLIGGPLPDLQTYILDRHMQPVPVGISGEMYVGGAGLSRGYCKRPDLTAERFVPHPFALEPGMRLYKTGDLARYLPDGDIEYLGRIDQQVKIRGFRIELGEIEAVMCAHAAVREGIVLAREDASGEKHLVAWLVPGPERAVNVSDLRNSMKEKLPEYMIPSSFVMLENLPLTPNGKVDYRALPEPDGTRPDLEMAYVAPRTPTEETLASIWEEVLGLEQVGIHDNFFDLGGDSISSIQVHAKAQQRGLSFSIQQLFRHSTIGDLARHVTTVAQATALEHRTKPFSLISGEERARLPQEVEDAYPLAALQAGMLFHSSYHPDSAVYHNISSVHLRAPFDLQAMEAAIRQLTARHPVLRTSFDLVNFSEPLQLVHRAVDVPFAVEDLSPLSEAEQQERLDEWFESEKHRQFDWMRAPLLRFNVHLRGEESFQFSWTEHHAILDGWSVASMITELFQLYFAAYHQALPEIEPPPATTFRDFVALERAAIESEANRHFWLERLAGGVATVLPRLPNLQKAMEGGQSNTRVLISPKLSADLKKLGRELGVPLKSVLLAAHLRVLSLLGGQTDVTTGVVSNGRPETLDAERTLGLFLNTLPFRLSLDGGTWADLIRATFEAEQQMLPSRRFPLAELHRLVGGKPLFETTFNYIHFHVYQNLSGFKDAALLSERSFADTNFAFAATFHLDPFTSDLELSLSYQPSQFSDEQIRAAGVYYTNALQAMVDTPLSRYESTLLLSPQERQQILTDWNNTRIDYGEDTCLHHLIERQVERTPEACALIFEEQQVSYRELNERANQLAHHLRRHGVGPEVLVGVLMQRSVELVVGLLGVLKAGGAYVPLDPSYPAQRLSFMLEDSRAQLLLTQADWAAQPVVPTQLRVVKVDADGAEIGSESRENPVAGSLPQHLAYVIYTSGSTGSPKGAMNTHAAICNRLLWMQEAFALDQDDAVLQKTPFSFDVSVWEFFWPLMTGARLVVARPGGHQDAAYLVQTIVREQVTTLHFVPSMLHVFLEERDLTRCASLRRVICSGEALSFELQEKFFARLPAELYNLYGPTEAAVDVTSWRCQGNRESALVPIGRPIANTQIYLLDAAMQPVPVGVLGELYIGGVALARGYFGRADLSAERFIPHPFSDSPGGRLYKTGDLARYLPGGEIEFLGRIDDQVKIRGLRIEPGEIEAVLVEHPSIREVVIVAREDAAEEKRLVAYLVSEQRDAPSIKELRRFIKERLPEYMTPSAFVFLDEMPKTPNGKLDRRALPAPEADSAELKQSFVLPRDMLEHQLAQIWEEVLHVHPIGATHNFFELGGHSLLAISLMARVRHRFGRDVPLTALFEGATVERLASVLRLPNAEASTSPCIAIQANGSMTPFFAVHPIGGNIFCYFELSRHLGADQPFYAMQSQGLVKGQTPLPSVEKMATLYLSAMRERQPHGPYLLGGWSFGGAVAFEMAQQLRQLDEEVALLALIDTRAPASFEQQEAEDADIDAKLLVGFLSDMGGMSGQDMSSSFDTLRELEEEARLRYVIQRACELNLLPPQTDIAQVGRLLEVFKSNLRALQRYAPQRFEGRLDLFRASDSRQKVDDVTLGWDQVASRLEVHHVPGNHYTIMTVPHVRLVAERMKILIDEALARFNGEGSTASLVSDFNRQRDTIKEGVSDFEGT